MKDFEYSFKVASQDSLAELVESLDAKTIKKRLLKVLREKKLTNIQYGFLLDNLGM